MSDNTFTAWDRGDLTNIGAARLICLELRTLEAQISTLNTHRDALRDQLSQITAVEGDAITMDGIGTVRLTAPSVRVTYTATEVDRAVAELAAVYPAAAQRIAALRKETHVAGSLRIEWKKEKTQ